MKVDVRRLWQGRDDGGSEGDPRRVVPARPRAQLAARVGLWSLVGLGAVGGLVGMMRPAGQGTAEAEEAAGSASMPPEVGGFAELVVTTWLEAGAREAGLLEEPENGGVLELASLFVVDPPVGSDDTGVRHVTDATTVAARILSPRYWAVTVAAPVQELDGQQQWRTAGTWFLELGIVADGAGSLMAVSEPALVPAPRQPDAGAVPQPVGGALRAPASGEQDLADTVQGFVSALLVGDGDVSRYLAPDARLSGVVSPPPFTEATLHEWAVTSLPDGRTLAQVAVRGVSPAGVPRTLSYELGLVQRSGRWEVTSLSGAPTLLDTSSPNDAAPTTTTNRSPTTTAPETDGSSAQTPDHQTQTPPSDGPAVPRAPSTTQPTASQPGA